MVGAVAFACDVMRCQSMPWKVAADKLASEKDAAALITKVGQDLVDGVVAVSDLREHRDELIGSSGSVSPGGESTMGVEELS